MEYFLHINEYVRHGSDVILIFFSVCIFITWNKVAGALLFYYSSVSTIFVLSLNNMFGLGFIAHAFSRAAGDPVTPQIVIIDSMLSIAEPALVIAIALLINQIRSCKVVANVS